MSCEDVSVQRQIVSYAYDTLNRRCTKTIAATAVACGGSSANPTTLYSYDPLNRPTAISWMPAPAQATPTAANAMVGYGYDATNRRISDSPMDMSWSSIPVAPSRTVNYTANALNQYTAVGAVTPAYDGNGNLASDGTFTYCYDAESRLTGILSAGTCAAPTTTVASYAYDAQGRRKAKTVGSAKTVFVTDAVGREILEYNGTTGALNAWYAYGLGSNEVLNRMNVAAGTRQTLIPDILGSIIGTVDSGTGAVTKTGYQAFGENPSLTSGNFAYTAQRFDAETAGSAGEPSGLYYYRARMYSPVLGRFLQPDPIGYAGGANLYAYVGNDPINNIDPTGLFCTSSGGKLSCTSPGGISFSVPSPRGFPSNLGPSSTNYHAYNVPVNAGNVPSSRLMAGVINNPTPGSPSPATAGGTLNDATPSVWSAAAYIAQGALSLGQASPGNISPVMSYATKDQNGNPIVVNVTLSGHPLDWGYVVRYPTTNANGQTILNNEGEGDGQLQSSSSPVADLINNQWQGQSQGIINGMNSSSSGPGK